MELFRQVSIKVTAGIYYRTYVARDSLIFDGFEKGSKYVPRPPPRINTVTLLKHLYVPDRVVCIVLMLFLYP